MNPEQRLASLLEQFETARHAGNDRLLLDKRPDVVDEQQKSHKVKSLLQAIKKSRAYKGFWANMAFV